MNVKAILWTYRMRADGTASVKIYFSADGSGHSYVSTKLCVKPEDWDDKKGEVKKSHPMASQFNALIRKKTMEVMDQLLNGVSPGELKKKPTGKSLLVFTKEYIDEVLKGMHEIKRSTCQNYIYTLKRLNQYVKFAGLNDLAFDQVDMDFYTRWTNYMQAHHNCNRPGISKHVKNLKKFMNEAARRGLHKSDGHRTPGFKIYKKAIGTKIYLTLQEIEQLEKLDLSKHRDLEAERDRFLVSYYLIMRWSDSVRIRREWIFTHEGRNLVRYSSQKTATETIIPLKPEAERLLEKYNYNLGKTTNQEANRKLKLIAAMAGITAIDRDGEKEGPKCSFVATHTARRSAATNMYLQNVSLKLIADLGGWSRIETLKLYLRASGLETAIMATDLEFFR